MTTTLETLEPKLIWKLFRGLSAVPRPSKHEEKIRAHLRDLAKEHGLSFCEDDAGNLVITVPASSGHEHAPITVLQAHVDMVCEKNSDTEHDFDNEGIHLVLDTDAAGETIVRGSGTTLGADNGIGVAMALAAALDDSVVHGPLEILLTTDEEAGMTGAKALTPQSFKGRRMLNLDSEEDDALYIGCAGGCDTNLTWTLTPEQTDGTGETAAILVSGLRGGHSGCDIQENRANAIKLLTQVWLRSGVDGLRLGEASGGSKRNAIPREAHAIVYGPTGMTAALTESAAKVANDARDASREPDATIVVRSAEPPAHALNAADSARVLAAWAALPQGVLGTNPSVPGLVQTSNNVSTMSITLPNTGEGRVAVGCLSRSSSVYWNSVTLAQVAAAGRLAGAVVTTDNEYPGWEPNIDSALLATTRRVYEKLFGSTPEVAAIHAGLECGIIGKLVGEMDTVSFGPRIEGAHSPDERVYPESVVKSWSLLRAVLADLAT